MLRLLSLIVFTCSFSVFGFDWQGHRGARGLYPENTIGAMDEALKYPVTALELDVVISGDKKVVVSHESWMNPDICLTPAGGRVKKKEYNLYKMTYEEILRFDCGSLPHPRFPEQKKVSVGKPLLEKLLTTTEETLTKLNRKEVKYNIEIKSTQEEEKNGFQPDYKTFTDLAVASIRSVLSSSRFTIQSFDYRVLIYLHEKYPDVALVALDEDVRKPQEILKSLGFLPQIYSPKFSDLKAKTVKEYQDLAVKVIPWTVNSLDDMNAVKEMGVDGIITDYPNLISSVGVKKCPAKFNLFEGKCVKTPSHSMPSDQNPGWVCKNGYMQKRNRCVEIKIPKDAHFIEDGKTWVCNEGYERYRGTCKKI